MKRPLVLLLAAALLAPLAAAGESAREQLEAARLQLIETTREYRASLERLQALEAEQAARHRAAAERLRALAAQGLVARVEAERGERDAARAELRLEETQSRLAEADGVMAETLAAIEVARLEPVPGGFPVVTPSVVQDPGRAPFVLVEANGIEAFFAGRFGRALPVSARGQTPTHARLGLDHRHAVDVAVHPDSEEGRVLIAHLRTRGIPFLAFRGVVPGASTGPHVHIGPASQRL